MSRVARAMTNAWASVMHHRLNGGDGYPPFEECTGFDDVVDSAVLQSVGQLCDRSDVMYDATPGKYERPCLSLDRRTFIAYVMVDDVVDSIGRPPLLLGLLLHLYPDAGRYEPRRAGCFDSQQPRRSYRPVEWTSQTFGGLVGSANIERAVDQLLMRIEGEFWRVLDARLRPILAQL